MMDGLDGRDWVIDQDKPLLFAAFRMGEKQSSKGIYKLDVFSISDAYFLSSIRSLIFFFFFADSNNVVE